MILGISFKSTDLCKVKDEQHRIYSAWVSLDGAVRIGLSIPQYHSHSYQSTEQGKWSFFEENEVTLLELVLQSFTDNSSRSDK